MGYAKAAVAFVYVAESFVTTKEAAPFVASASSIHFTGEPRAHGTAKDAAA